MEVKRHRSRMVIHNESSCESRPCEDHAYAMTAIKTEDLADNTGENCFDNPIQEEIQTVKDENWPRRFAIDPTNTWLQCKVDEKLDATTVFSCVYEQYIKDMKEEHLLEDTKYAFRKKIKRLFPNTVWEKSRYKGRSVQTVTGIWMAPLKVWSDASTKSFSDWISERPKTLILVDSNTDFAILGHVPDRKVDGFNIFLQFKVYTTGYFMMDFGDGFKDPTEFSLPSSLIFTDTEYVMLTLINVCLGKTFVNGEKLKGNKCGKIVAPNMASCNSCAMLKMPEKQDSTDEDNSDDGDSSDDTENGSDVTGDDNADDAEKLPPPLPSIPRQTSKCLFCSKEFYRGVELTEHYKEIHKHTTGEPFECDICHKSFNGWGSFRNHKIMHRGEKPYMCDVCGKGFIRKFSLDEHLKIHTGEKPFKCVICTKAFSLRHHLIRHKRMHTGDKPYVCDICSKGFTQSGNLKAHLFIHGEKSFQCDVCGKKFKHPTTLKNHNNTHTGVKPYSCEVCSKSFILKQQLKKHQMIHTGEKPYVCDVCGKQFSRPNTLKYHSMIHTGVKPYSCEGSSKSFILKQLLKQHQMIPTGEKPYVCDVCGKEFSQPNTLKYHSMIHTGVKPYSCEVCSKSFIVKQQLKQHQKNHTGEKPYD